MERSEKWEQFMKESILGGVISVLTKEGSEGLTMQRVAEEAGVAKGTVYSYFANKAELLEAAVQVSLEPLTREIHGILESELDPAEKLRRLLARNLTYFEKNRETFRVLLYERHRVLGKQSRFRTSRYHTVVDQTAAVIAEGVRSGQFRDLDPVKVATMLIEANISLVHRRLFSENPGSLEEDCNLIFQIFLRGISVPAGEAMQDD